jgi:hypothetical protein
MPGAAGPRPCTRVGDPCRPLRVDAGRGPLCGDGERRECWRRGSRPPCSPPAAEASGSVAAACVRPSVTSARTSPAPLHGQDASEQAAIDQLLIELDGTPDTHRLGANALLGASLACAHAAAAHEGVALWRHLAPVGAQAGQIQGGSPMPRRAHRQYNRLLRIEEQTAATRCMSVAARSGRRVSRRQQLGCATMISVARTRSLPCDRGRPEAGPGDRLVCVRARARGSGGNVGGRRRRNGASSRMTAPAGHQSERGRLIGGR